MNNTISREDRIVWDKPRQTGPLTEEDIEQRKLVRELMSSLDFKAVKLSMTQGRRRFTDAHEAQGGGPRPGALIAHSDDVVDKMVAVLKDLRLKEKDGSLRMSLIDKMLAEFDAGKAGAGTGINQNSGSNTSAPGASNNTTQHSGVIVEISEEAKNASKASEAAKSAAGTKPFKVTPPAEHPMLAKIRAIAMADIESRQANGKSHDISSIVPSDWQVFDASGDLEFKDSGLSIQIDTQSVLESKKFFEGSIHDVISKALSSGMGKAEANIAAIEIGYLVKSAAANNGDYLEDRAANREIGLKLAEHFANSYIKNEDERNTFIEVIGNFAKRDEMLDKGYVFNGTEAIEYYKPSPGNSFEQNYWDNHLSEKDKERMANEFAANVKKADKIINNSAAAVTSDDVIKILVQIQDKMDRINKDDFLTNKQWVDELSMKSNAIQGYHSMDGVTNFTIDYNLDAGL